MGVEVLVLDMGGCHEAAVAPFGAAREGDLVKVADNSHLLPVVHKVFDPDGNTTALATLLSKVHTVEKVLTVAYEKENSGGTI